VNCSGFRDLSYSSVLDEGEGNVSASEREVFRWIRGGEECSGDGLGIRTPGLGCSPDIG
jgi:hypothetical protein